MGVILAIALTGIITGAITSTIFQVVIGSLRTNNHMIVVRQVQNAGYWVSHDAQMAQTIDTGDDPLGEGFPLVLTWTDWAGDEHQVTYVLENMIGGPKQLRRSHSINGGQPSESIIAQYIVPGKPKTSVVPTNGALIFTVTASVGEGSQEESETRTYEIVPRPGS